MVDSASQQDDPTEALIPTKDQARDPAELKARMKQWLGQRLGAGDTLELDMQIPSGSGVANETLVISARWQQDGAPRTGDFVVRIEAEDPLFPGSDAKLQFDMYRALEGFDAVPTPRAVDFEGDRSLLGAPFFLMERIDGRVPPDNPHYNHAGWVTELTDADRAAMWRNGVGALAKLHSVDVGRFPFLKDTGASDGLRANLNYYIEEFDEAYGAPHAVIDHVRDWLIAHYPADPIPGFSWGDARLGNIIFDGNNEVAAVLDWDMVSLAGPMTDLVWWACFDISYTYGMGKPRLGGFGTARQTIELWEKLSGMKVRHLDWHIVFNQYRGAVIVRRLTRMLREQGRMPPSIAFMEQNNGSIQYLADMFELPPAGDETRKWPGLDV